MKKELFVKILNQLRDNHDKTESFCDLLDELAPDSHCCATIYEKNDNLLFDILEEEYGEEIVENYIAYFAYEIDFGEGYEPGSILDDDGNDIALSTVERLYDICEEEKKRKYEKTEG